MALKPKPQGNSDTTKEALPRYEPAKLHPSLYKLICSLVFGASAVLIVIGLITWTTIIAGEGFLNLNVGFPFIAIPIIYFFSSLREVKEDEQGTLYFYGLALKNVSHGIHFVPRFLIQRRTVETDIQEMEAPGPRNQIFWGDEKEPMPQGMVRPIFVTSRSQNPGEDRALDVQLQYGVGYYVLWKVANDQTATFFQNTRSLKEGASQIEKLSLSILDQIIGEHTAEGVIADQANTAKRFVERICDAVSGMGITINDAGLHGLNLSHDMATAMRDRAKAQFEAETLVIQTQAQATNIEKLGEAKGKAAQSEARGPLVGRAEGMAKLMEVLSVEGDTLLVAEMLREALPRGTIIAGASDGTADLLGMVKAGEAALKGQGSSEK